MTFGELQPRLSPRVRARLERSWAGGFRRQVLPLLLEAETDFADLYADKNGRPNWSVARLLGLMLLQEWFDFPDQQALDAMSFDVRWQFALGLEQSEAVLSRRSLGEFRSRLVRVDPQMTRLRGVFDRVSSAAIKSLKLSTTKQRIDSTQICSNIQSHGRVFLFRTTLEHCLRALKKVGRLPQLSAPVQAMLEKKTGWFAATGTAERRARLLDLARYAVEVRRTFANDDAVLRLEAYQLLCKLLDEQVELLDDDEGDSTGGSGDADGQSTDASKTSTQALRLKSAKKQKGDTLQSPYDPDATCGHKGVGYLVHSTETCGNTGTEIITDVAVVPANTGDVTQSTPAIERLAARGLKPERLFADAGYGSGKTLLEAEVRGVTLEAPVSLGALPEGHIGRDAFTFDAESGEVLQCPKGHAPRRHGMRKPADNSDRRLHAFFDGQQCKDCPLVGKCAARHPNSGKGTYRLDLALHLRRRDERLAQQKPGDPWWVDYRIRSGVEATQSELKRAHGMGRLRVRRGARVRLSVIAKVTACNVKRWLRATAETHQSGTGPRRRRSSASLWRRMSRMWLRVARCRCGFGVRVKIAIEAA